MNLLNSQRFAFILCQGITKSTFILELILLYTGNYYYSLASSALVLQNLSLLCLMKTQTISIPTWAFKIIHSTTVWLFFSHVTTSCYSQDLGIPLRISRAILLCTFPLSCTLMNKFQPPQPHKSAQVPNGYFGTLFHYWILSTSFKQLSGLTSFVPFSLESI